VEVFETSAVRAFFRSVPNRNLIVGGIAVLSAILVAATLEALLKPWDWGDEELIEEW
jgi:hypothetical protein